MEGRHRRRLDPQLLTNSARPRIFDGGAEAKLTALARSLPPKGGKRWTLLLLETVVVELSIVDRASDITIGRTLKKAQAPPPEAMGHPAKANAAFVTGSRAVRVALYAQARQLA